MIRSQEIKEKAREYGKTTVPLFSGELKSF